MIEITIYEYLKDALGVPVYTETPVNPPDEYVRIERTNGGETNGIEHALIAVQSISALSLYRAAEINEEVKAAMRSLYLPSVYSAKLNADYNYTNTSTKQYRYQAVFDIYY